MSILLKGLQDNNAEIMQTITKIIAVAVKNEIKGFRAEYLSDSQMKELNPLIRAGIYNALFAIANCDDDTSSKNFIGWCLHNIPGYWEDAQLSPMFIESFENLTNANIQFDSPFLNEQYQIGNIYFVPNKKCIQLRGSYEFIGVQNSEGKTFRGKITNNLRKEGYIYDPYKEGYIKP